MVGEYLYYIWLSMIPQIGVSTQKKLLNQMGSPEEIYHATDESLSLIKGISSAQIHNIIELTCLDDAKRIVDNCYQKGIKILSINDEYYPARAKEDMNSPIILYTKGRILEDKLKKTVAIVGARRCTQSEKRATADIALQYIQKGYSIISGMAKGVDSYGHTVCIKEDGYTVAVLGNGLDICYPKEHNTLMRAIEDNGLLLSEYPPGVKPQRYHFPQRNRIIAQWSDEIVVVAPGNRSGSLITAEYAERLGRQVDIIN